MALDWNMQIGGNKTTGKKKNDVPTKSVMNLAQRDAVNVDLRKAAPVALLLLVLIVLFTKFLVIDYYAQVTAKQAELSTYTTQLNALKSKTAGFDAVSAEYESYAGVSEASGQTVSAEDVLNMLAAAMGDTSSITSLDNENNTLTFTMTGVTLEYTSEVAANLQQQPLVSAVSVSNATTGTNNDTSTVASTIEVTLNSQSATGTTAAAKGGN